MTVRLYFNDAYTSDFTATVVNRRVADGRPALALDQTHFYPTSGGQPADHGTLDGQPVVDVVEDDGTIWHVLEGADAEMIGVRDGSVAGQIDWSRRFDHMQQHSGQHLLSRALIEVAGAETVGFHLGVDNVTIDLDRPDLASAAIAAAERLANDIIWESRPITAFEVSSAAAADYPLRKAPAVDGDLIRLVTIADFDVTPCGGTHVAQTGSVGAIKIVRLERRGGQLRVTFHCGARALDDYGVKHDVVSALTATLTTGAAEVTTAVDRLQQDNKALQGQLRRQAQQLRGHLVATLLDHARPLGQARLVSHVLDAASAEPLAPLARELVGHEGVVVLLGLPGERAQLVCARAEGVPGDMRLALEAALATLDGGRGGGRENFAQGGGAAGPEALASALATAEATLRQMASAA